MNLNNIIHEAYFYEWYSYIFFFFFGGGGRSLLKHILLTFCIISFSIQRGKVFTKLHIETLLASK